MSQVPDAPTPSRDLRRRNAAPAALATSSAAPSASPTPPPAHPQQPPPPPPAALRPRTVAGALGASFVTAAVGGTYLLVENETALPFVVLICLPVLVALVRFAISSVTADGGGRVRARHFRSHGHFTGERAAYVRTSQRLTMMDRDFTDADYDMLLDLDNNSQRLRMFLEGASHETVARLPTYIHQGNGRGAGAAAEAAAEAAAAVVAEEEGPLSRGMDHIGVGGAEGDGRPEAKEPTRTMSAVDLEKLRRESDAGGDESSKIAGATGCTICLEDFEDGMKIRILPCFHRFMAKCIDPWLVQQARCPVCKCSIQEVMNTLPPGCK